MIDVLVDIDVRVTWTQMTRGSNSCSRERVISLGRAVFEMPRSWDGLLTWWRQQPHVGEARWQPLECWRWYRCRSRSQGQSAAAQAQAQAPRGPQSSPQTPTTRQARRPSARRRAASSRASFRGRSPRHADARPASAVAAAAAASAPAGCWWQLRCACRPPADRLPSRPHSPHRPAKEAEAQCSLIVWLLIKWILIDNC